MAHYSLILDYQVTIGDGDPGFAISNAQKNTLPADVISGVVPVTVTVTVTDNSIILTTSLVLVTGLIIPHPWYSDHWLWADSSYPDLQFPFFVNAGASVEFDVGGVYWRDLINTVQTS